MTIEIPKEKWKEFFDNLSRDLVDWETFVEVVSDNVGAQKMAEGMPFNGLTFEEGDRDKIELSLGTGTGGNQTHNIVQPKMVAFEGTGVGPGGVLDIEDSSGTKTLVKFARPYPVLVEYVKSELISASQQPGRKF